ncbi:hypothetical protein BjapCC829_06185 [Bradyrhizobium barranii]|uniref:Uncharacterized protein n=1 Tax=Bradyrhizobium barranii TaxID=2992140 RepID=A0ABY3QQB3_9BRAD|nr:hypothetical protein [Bradyrhizobium japonicum]UFW88187.1 hypothetical protein BjapCC829_06185 [Bradyrhizobium japonicum]
MLLRDGKLPLQFSGHGSQTACAKDPSSIRALPLPTGQRASGGQFLKFPTGAEGKRLQISRGAISASRCLTANALAVNRSPVILPTDESWCDA